MRGCRRRRARAESLFPRELRAKCRAAAYTTGRMYFAASARHRTTQNAESGIASSMPSSGPSTVDQKKKLKMTPA